MRFCVRSRSACNLQPVVVDVLHFFVDVPFRLHVIIELQKGTRRFHSPEIMLE